MLGHNHKNLLLQTWAAVPVRASVCVIMNWIDLLLYPWVTCKWAKIRKNKKIFFYSFLIFTFTFSLSVAQKVLYVILTFTKVLMVFWLLHVVLFLVVQKVLIYFLLSLVVLYLWSKSPCVFLTFDFSLFPSALVVITYGLLIPFKVHHHKPIELLMLLSHTMCHQRNFEVKNGPHKVYIKYYELGIL